MMPPEMCAMPEVITVMSSDWVMCGRYGRMVSGASVCPMKMLAATLSDSAPLAFMNAAHADGEQPHHELHHAQVVEDREQRRDEDDRRQHLEGEEHRVAGAVVAEHRGHDARPRLLVAERAEHEGGADVAEVEQPVDAPGRARRTAAGRGRLQHQQREERSAGRGPRPRSAGRWHDGRRRRSRRWSGSRAARPATAPWAAVRRRR